MGTTLIAGHLVLDVVPKGYETPFPGDVGEWHPSRVVCTVSGRISAARPNVTHSDSEVLRGAGPGRPWRTGFGGHGLPAPR
jgi:hypothetical protein